MNTSTNDRDTATTPPSSPSPRNSFAHATPLERLRHRVRLQLHAILSLNATTRELDSGLTIALYNWARDLLATRGFTPIRRVGLNGGDHGHDTLLRLLAGTTAAETLEHLLGLLQGETKEVRDQAVRHFVRWAMDARRALLMERFQALSSEAHGLQGLLANIASATPHGKSNALEHGVQSRWYFSAVLHALSRAAGAPVPPARYYPVYQGHLDSVKVPSWALVPANAKWLLGAIAKFNYKEICEYLFNHDVGKAFCMTVDENGRAHYPNHAEVSSQVWAKAGGSALVCELMRKDMLVHKASAEDCVGLARDPLMPVLLLASVAEINANAVPIFGGFESDSFKIKMKHIERRGNALLATWGGAR